MNNLDCLKILPSVQIFLEKCYFKIKEPFRKMINSKYSVNSLNIEFY